MILLKTFLGLMLIAQTTDSSSLDLEAAKEQPPLATPSIDEFSFTYNPFGKRDPFRGFLESETQNQVAPSDPLQGYPLANFKLTGILWGLAAPKAIVEVAGKGFIIGRGSRIGLNRGRVVSILRDQILVAEEHRDSLGKLVVKEFQMKLESKDKR
jgi:type IV pilus assembly protein PilP